MSLFLFKKLNTGSPEIAVRAAFLGIFFAWVWGGAQGVAGGIESATTISDGHLMQSFSGRGRFEKPRPDVNNPFFTDRQKQELLKLPGEPGPWGWRANYQLATAAAWSLGHRVDAGLDWDAREDLRFTTVLGMETSPREKFSMTHIDFELSFVFPSSVIFDPDRVLTIDELPKDEVIPDLASEVNQVDDKDTIRMRRAQAVDRLYKESYFMLRAKASFAGIERGNQTERNSYSLDLFYTFLTSWSVKTGYTGSVYTANPASLVSGFRIFTVDDGSTTLSSLRKIMESFPKDQLRAGTAGFIGERFLLDLEVNYSRYHFDLMPWAVGFIPSFQYFFSERWRAGLGSDLLVSDRGFSLSALVGFGYRW